MGDFVIILLDIVIWGVSFSTKVFDIILVFTQQFSSTGNKCFKGKLSFLFVCVYSLEQVWNRHTFLYSHIFLDDQL